MHPPRSAAAKTAANTNGLAFKYGRSAANTKGGGNAIHHCGLPVLPCIAKSRVLPNLNLEGIADE
jgi:hypothetical protein